jgi:peptide methionine sulfoxide reductase msrA/msrB
MNIRIISVGVIAIIAAVAITTGLYIATDGFADKTAVSLAPVLAPTADISSETPKEQVSRIEEAFTETVVEPEVEKSIDAEEDFVVTEEAGITALPDTSQSTAVLPQAKEATAVLANGCFWCVEHDLEPLPGVINVVSGYTGGATNNPTYKNHATDNHREAVLVTYNPQLISYANLVEHIIKHGDPTDATGSFFDRGPQYAPALYYSSAEELRVAQSVIHAVNETGVFVTPLPLPVLERKTFYPAEDYHQDYAKNNSLKYSHYRKASGRTAYIDRIWGSERTTFTISNTLSAPVVAQTATTQFITDSWDNFVSPDEATLRATLSASAYKVTQEDGTERAWSSPLDANYEPGIYVDVVSGEPLFSSRDKYDSGTGWPSFVKPISDSAVVLHEDKKLFTTRTEVRSQFADSHLGHVFSDGPVDRGGLRYCMNGVALRFISESEMEKEGYTAWLPKS